MSQLILVTGGEGRFAKILKKKNKFLNLYFAKKSECNILNLNSLEKIIKKIKPKIILHCAGLSRPMEIHEKDISKSIDLNIIGTSNITKICKKFNLKLIYFSTGYVYEGIKGNYSEKDPVKPFRYKNAYSNLKTNFMFHEDVVELLPKVIKEKGIINIGGKSQSVYHFVKNYDKKIKKTSINSNTQMPLKQTMDTSKLKKLLSKK